jgi:biopolymer transport protein ExbB/TolQ
VATAAGLFVAIPAVTAYNHFVSRVKVCATEMDGAGSEVLGRLLRAASAESADVRSVG